MALSPEDRLAIEELLARYNHAIDSRDGDAWLACFTNDAIYEFPPDRYVEGIDALREAAAQRAAGAGPDTRHWLNNVVIEGDGDAAHVRCYLALVRPEDPPRVNHTGIYDFELRREDDRWKFTRRTMIRDGAASQ